MEPFATAVLDDGVDWFRALSDATVFERLGPGRRAAVVVEPTLDGSVPIVRTTTPFASPAQPFNAAYGALIATIAAAGAPAATGPMRFNNALVEVYDDTYASMGYHTDQSLDLAADSSICLFSCYSSPAASQRILRVQHKATGATRDIDLRQASIVVFSTHANGTHLHKILRRERALGGEWLGVTLRLSKTYVVADNDGGGVRLAATRSPLRLATDAERRTFIQLKRAENDTDGPFVYPMLDYTLSASDVVMPRDADNRRC